MTDTKREAPASLEKRAAALELVLRRKADMPKPAYIRGKTGTIVHVATPTPFPDAAGHNTRPEMEPTYDARFRARDLWPDTSDEALNHVAVFQSYLEKSESA